MKKKILFIKNFTHYSKQTINIDIVDYCLIEFISIHQRNEKIKQKYKDILILFVYSYLIRKYRLKLKWSKGDLSDIFYFVKENKFKTLHNQFTIIHNNWFNTYWDSKIVIDQKILNTYKNNRDFILMLKLKLFKHLKRAKRKNILTVDQHFILDFIFSIEI